MAMAVTAAVYQGRHGKREPRPVSEREEREGKFCLREKSVLLCTSAVFVEVYGTTLQKKFSENKFFSKTKNSTEE